MQRHCPTLLVLLFSTSAACDFSGVDGGTDTEGGTSSSSPTATDPIDTSADDTGAVPDDGSGGGSGGVGVAECEVLCNDLVDAACSAGPTIEGCRLTCQALTSTAECDAKAATYFTCVEDGEVVCNGLGEPSVPECGLAYLDAIGCAVTNNPNPDLVEPCAAQCDAIEATGCRNNATNEDCNTNCLWLGATGTGCDDEWGGYLSCFEEAELSCLFGFAVADGCGPEFVGYTECIDAAGS